MNVKKFVAPTSRDALRKVREALGPDAVILSNRAVNGEVEILALASDDVASIASPVAESEMAAPAPQLQLSEPQPFMPRRVRAEPQPEPKPAIDMAAVTSMVSSAIEKVTEAATAEMSGMMNEMRAMRGLMESQLAELTWGASQQRAPHKATVLREMLAAGFSATLSRYLIDKLPQHKDAAESMRWVKNVIGRNLSVMSNEDAILGQGGVFALVGPTGVGKTTTTAKLAARCVMRHGPEKLALITTDAYRIGAHEQLRIYGKILGVMVHAVKDEADLRIALKELKNKHTVLIDTIGMSQRDQMVAAQVAMLTDAGAEVKRLLCLNSTSTHETLGEVVRAYQGSGLHGVIMTKLDEAASIGSLLDVLVRQKLNLCYISNGQRVPEDLHLADRALLVDRAFRGKREQLQEADLPAVMSQTGSVHSDRTLREVSLG
ncbi:flagellar biosynthesis protein FlhF [Massilia agilis]|uniref:Flagellar biosynthesis protein FlhF n=2 Tax=Massilia TaxID=149698 RepID=A0ABT2BF00_9BURK|nr:MULTISPECIES: flagellar biosynthesis protein FlhF [Massilia]MCS0607010.1 flagellar biosynthesis protein FlhF [Massilia solisilvae]MCS0807420.1 flagellar biosynthesis protein FlhF [Massilia agilis]